MKALREQRAWRTAKRDAGTTGITVVELLVVLSILGLLAAVAIPTFARAGFFSRNELQSSARELTAMLQAAKIYAATYRVNTAVVYYDPNGLNCLQAASVMYEHPSLKYEVSDSETKSFYVPVDGEAGFRELPGDTGVIFDVPTSTPTGFNPVKALFFSEPDAASRPDLNAHIFEPGGKLVAGTGTERYEIHVGFAPDTDDIERRDGDGNVRSMTIELLRSTGRVRIASE